MSQQYFEHEELLNEFVGKKGTSERDKYEQDLKISMLSHDFAKITKKYLKESVARLSDASTDPLKDLVYLKAIQRILGDSQNPGLLKALEAKAFAQFAQIAEGNKAKIGACTIEQGEAGVTYDYSHDPIWRLLNHGVEAAKSYLKEHEALLRSVPKSSKLKPKPPVMLVDPETGEEYQAKPPVKRSSTVLKFGFD